MKVLVVEDSKLLAHMVGDGLRAHHGDQAGFEVCSAPDGRQALAQLAEHRFDAIVVDVYLPGIDGCEVIRRARDELGLRDVPIIAISAGGHEARELAIGAGATAFFDKPFKVAQVAALVRALT
jgi:DNA-binding response OmpR family regulator